MGIGGGGPRGSGGRKAEGTRRRAKGISGDRGRRAKGIRGEEG